MQKASTTPFTGRGVTLIPFFSQFSLRNFRSFARQSFGFRSHILLEFARDFDLRVSSYPSLLAFPGFASVVLTCIAYLRSGEDRWTLGMYGRNEVTRTRLVGRHVSVRTWIRNR